MFDSLLANSMNAEHTDRSVVESVSSPLLLSSPSSSIESVTNEFNDSAKRIIHHFNKQIDGINVESNAINDMEQRKTSGCGSDDSNGCSSGQPNKCCDQIANKNNYETHVVDGGGAKSVDEKEVNASNANINNNNNNNNSNNNNNNNNNNNDGEASDGAAVAKISFSADDDAPASTNETVCDVISTAEDIKKLKHVQGRSNSTGKLYHSSRRVSFPEHDSELVTGYLEPANPWACG